MTTTFASPPRLRRRVDASGAVETVAAMSWERWAGAFVAGFAVETAPRAVFLM